MKELTSSAEIRDVFKSLEKDGKLPESDTTVQSTIDEKKTISKKITIVTKKGVADNIQFYKDNTIKDDRWAAPYTKGKFNLLVASTNSGKTTYTVSLALRAALEGQKVLVLLTEDSPNDFMTLFPNHLEEEVLNRIGLVELSSYTREQFEEIVEYASDEGYEYLVWDYVEISSFDTESTDMLRAYRELGNLINITTSKKGRKLFFFVTIQGNRAFSDMIGAAVVKIGEPKGKDKKKITSSLDLLPSVVNYFTLEYMKLIDGGVTMPQRAKSIVFSFNFGPAFLHLVVKQKTIGDEQSYIGELYQAKLDTYGRTINLLPLDNPTNMIAVCNFIDKGVIGTTILGTNALLDGTTKSEEKQGSTHGGY